jgi:hypothetical protein
MAKNIKNNSLDYFLSMLDFKKVENIRTTDDHLVFASSNLGRPIVVPFEVDIVPEFVLKQYFRILRDHKAEDDFESDDF